MKQRVVFLFYHGLGHINAFLKAGQILEDSHYEVYFAGNGFFQRYISLLNVKFYALKTHPFGMGLESWINTQKKKKYVYLSALRDRITDSLYNERKVELFWMLEEIKPSIVLIDSLQATDFIVLHARLKNRNIKVAMIHTMLPAQVMPGLPPLNSDVLPGDNVAVRKAIRKMKWGQLKKTLANKFKWLGFDDRFITNRRLKRNSIPHHYISTSLSFLNFSVSQVDEFILAPREFNFPDFTPALTHHYIGFMTSFDRNYISEPEFNKVASHIHRLKKNKSLKLIYCSFGTIEPKKKEVIFSFLKRLFQVTIDEDHVLLISLIADQGDITKLPAHENIYIFKSLPQLEILRHADLFITHGGLNSIKESVFAEVPLLVYPVHPEYDPNGNAVRVVYHGLGLRGKASTDTQDEIKVKIKELMRNSCYKKNIQALKRKDKLYTKENFLEKVEALKFLSP
jgi:UDP:flavonoid glycosyltransferase YjiC (YdhE family)